MVERESIYKVVNQLWIIRENESKKTQIQPNFNYKRRTTVIIMKIKTILKVAKQKCFKIEC